MMSTSTEATHANQSDSTITQKARKHPATNSFTIISSPNEFPTDTATTDSNKEAYDEDEEIYEFNSDFEDPDGSKPEETDIETSTTSPTDTLQKVHVQRPPGRRPFSVRVYDSLHEALAKYNHHFSDHFEELSEATGLTAKQLRKWENNQRWRSRSSAREKSMRAHHATKGTDTSKKMSERDKERLNAEFMRGGREDIPLSERRVLAVELGISRNSINGWLSARKRYGFKPREKRDDDDSEGGEDSFEFTTEERRGREEEGKEGEDEEETNGRVYRRREARGRQREPEMMREVNEEREEKRVKMMERMVKMTDIVTQQANVLKVTPMDDREEMELQMSVLERQIEIQKRIMQQIRREMM
ncbi:hypothetical protein PROFUN_01651 [Planoprotostelium fungivorum]|uniref:Homeobox domain-containing protein n=1 Tax=Planoprotostelium fungivorum TaxID=1890364 RepID=A0A2P6MW56_9EUKA|nr:hypothetical protein PROFUN_01651 [Planoprotostelium fungivorum]